MSSVFGASPFNLNLFWRRQCNIIYLKGFYFGHPKCPSHIKAQVASSGKRIGRIVSFFHLSLCTYTKPHNDPNIPKTTQNRPKLSKTSPPPTSKKNKIKTDQKQAWESQSNPKWDQNWPKTTQNKTKTILTYPKPAKTRQSNPKQTKITLKLT